MNAKEDFMVKEKILVVDDKKDICETLCELLEEEGYETASAQSGNAALKKLTKGPFDIMIVDLKMPGMGGIEFIKEAKQIHPEILAMILTGYPSVPTIVEAVQIEAFDYITKPFEREAIIDTIKKAIEKRRG